MYISNIIFIGAFWGPIRTRQCTNSAFLGPGDTKINNIDNSLANSTIKQDTLRVFEKINSVYMNQLNIKMVPVIMHIGSNMSEAPLNYKRPWWPLWTRGT